MLTATDETRPLGLLLTKRDARQVDADTKSSLIQSNVPFWVVENLDDGALQSFNWLVGRHADMSTALKDCLAEAASMRVQHEQLQRNFLAAESWLQTAANPKFVRVGEVAPTKVRLALAAGAIVAQRLPAPTTSLIGVDIFLAGAHDARIKVTILRHDGQKLRPFRRANPSHQPGDCGFS